MGRKATLTAGQVEAIRASLKTQKALATEFEVSSLTIGKVLRFQGAYRQHVLELGTPVLDSSGIVVNITPPEDEEDFIPFVPPIRHD